MSRACTPLASLGGLCQCILRLRIKHAGRENAAARLRSVLAHGSDDPHAADALLAFFRRGIACGAFREDEVGEATGVGEERLRA